MTVLTMTSILTTTNRSMPPVSYLKAVDIYLGICYFMVVAALLEYAMVCYGGKKLKDRQVLAEKRKEEEDANLQGGHRRQGQGAGQDRVEMQPMLLPPSTSAAVIPQSIKQSSSHQQPHHRTHPLLMPRTNLIGNRHFVVSPLRFGRPIAPVHVL